MKSGPAVCRAKSRHCVARRPASGSGSPKIVAQPKSSISALVLPQRFDAENPAMREKPGAKAEGGVDIGFRAPLGIMVLLPVVCDNLATSECLAKYQLPTEPQSCPKSNNPAASHAGTAKPTGDQTLEESRIPTRTYGKTGQATAKHAAATRNKPLSPPKPSAARSTV
jgi:hypothetical protein